MKRVKTIVTICAGLSLAGSIAVTFPPPKKAHSAGAKFIAHADTLTPPPVASPAPPSPPPPAAPAEEVSDINSDNSGAQNGSHGVVSGITGSLSGYALPYGNCVDEARAWGKNQPGRGNPINWVWTTKTPFVGAGMLFNYNHVAIVVGINWDAGTVTVRHRNYKGGQYVFPISSARGYY